MNSLSRQTLEKILKYQYEGGVDTVINPTPTDKTRFKNEATIPKVSHSSLQKEDSKNQELFALSPPLIPLKQSIQDAINLAKRANSISELRETLSNFEDCSLKRTATHLVFSDGNPKASIMVVGEAPGADEDRQGLPFVGVSGQLLDRAFATIGLNRTNIYISNILPWRPPGNRQPTLQEIALCQPFIERHIELIQPRYLILAGGTAAKALLKAKEGIVKLRGQWRSYQTAGLKQPIEALATFHPAYLLRSPGQKKYVWLDLLSLKQKLTSL